MFVRLDSPNPNPHIIAVVLGGQIRPRQGSTTGSCGKASLPPSAHLPTGGPVDTHVSFYGGSDPDRVAAVAAGADLVVVFAGTSSTEGTDRASLSLPPDQVRG